MILETKNIAFYLVFIATIIAGVAELSGNSELNHIPDIVVLIVFFLLFMSGKVSIPTRVAFFSLPILIIIAVVILYNIYFGRPLLGGSGIIGLIIISIIFVCILNSDNSPEQVYSLERQISILFAIHIVYILFETIFLMTYGYDFMKLYISKYRNLTGQPIYELLGLSSPGGANGIMVGPQVASQMLALSIIWFAPIYKKAFPPIRYLPRKYLWILSIVLYPFCMTGTSLIMLTVLSLMILFIYPKSLTRMGFSYIKLSLIILLLLGVLTGGIWDLLLYRITRLEGTDLEEIYLYTFMDPVIAFIQLPMESKLFGMQDDFSLLRHTDFGLAAMIWKGGLLLTMVGILSFIAILIRGYVILRSKIVIRHPIVYKWCILTAASAISSIGWFVSLGHYTVAVEPGGKHFFAFMIAATVVSLMRLNTFGQIKAQLFEK